MLTAYQCATVAYATDGGIICPECAARRYSTLTLHKIDHGLDNSAPDVSPWIRYTLDEYIGDLASEYATEEAGDWHEDPEVWDEAFGSYPDFIYCDDCGGEIS